MTFIFDGDVAEIVGANAAVIFWNLKFWIAKNKANDKNYHDGRYWTYNSKKAFQELFPFLSEQGIKTALNKLIEADLITTGDYNAKKFDRTLWYALTEKGERIGENQPTNNGEIQPLHRGNSTVPSVNNNRPIPDINTDMKTDINNICAKEAFEQFWEAYPKKRDKAKAKAAFIKATKKTTLDFILSALKKQKQSKDWQKENGQYIPYPTTWLNGERWNDELSVESNNTPADSSWLQEAIDRYKEKERT